MAFLYAGIIFLALVLFIFLLLKGITIKFKISINNTEYAVETLVCLMFGLIKIPIKNFGNLNQPAKTSKQKRSGVKPKGRKLMRLVFKSLKNAVNIKSIRLKGKIGILEDSVENLMLAGAIRILFLTASRFLSCENASAMGLVPEFETKCFWLNLDGIIKLRFGQIIGIMMEEIKQHDTSY